MKTLEKIYLILTEKLAASFLDVKDDSAEHAGHKEAEKSGGGHFAITIVSSAFEGKPLTERHRMVYALLRDEFKNEIHALGIKAYTLSEWEKIN